MREKLQQIESYLQSLVEGHTLQIFGSSSAEKRLVQELLNALENQMRNDKDGNFLAPNNFSLIVPSETAPDVRSNQILLDNLANHLHQAGTSAGISFEGTITINVFPNESLPEGDFQVKAIWKDEQVSSTQPVEISSLELSTPPPLPKAFLIVGGIKIFTLENDVINIGRQLDNNLVLDDPRVSRKHCQIRMVKGRHMLFDLGSSGGTYVNNSRITQIALHPGDVVSLAGVPLVYGQDAIIKLDETQEYQPPNNISNSGSASTTTIKINQREPDKLVK